MTEDQQHGAPLPGNGNGDPTPQDKALTLSDPLSVAKASVGLVLQEAVNLGEINPAMGRRFGERIDQIFTALMRGAGIQWDPTNGSLKIIYPEIENPFLAAAAARKRERELESSTAIPTSATEPQPGQPYVEVKSTSEKLPL